MSHIDATLADWKAKTDAATAPPWFREYGDVVTGDSDPRDAWADEPRAERVIRSAGHRELRDPRAIADAEFIAMSRTAVPRLLAAVANALSVVDSIPEYSNLRTIGILHAGQYALATRIRAALNDAIGGSDE